MCHPCVVHPQVREAQGGALPCCAEAHGGALPQCCISDRQGFLLSAHTEGDAPWSREYRPHCMLRVLAPSPRCLTFHSLHSKRMSLEFGKTLNLPPTRPIKVWPCTMGRTLPQGHCHFLRALWRFRHAAATLMASGGEMRACQPFVRK